MRCTVRSEQAAKSSGGSGFDPGYGASMSCTNSSLNIQKLKNLQSGKVELICNLTLHPDNRMSFKRV